MNRLFQPIAVMLIIAVEGSVARLAEAADSASSWSWSFDGEAGQQFDLHGEVKRDRAGPRPPEYPDFASDNTAMAFAGGYLAIADPPDADPYDFHNGDAITIGAWVNISAAREGQQTYIVGKGRSGSPHVARDNQNWALRAVAHGGIVRASFLFATDPASGDSHWHRWTTESGFKADSGWHHFAVTYVFGKPGSIRGYVDGVPSDGRWDMGGETTKPPVVDEDDVWIGSANGGRSSNSFHGLIDQVILHRRQLNDEEIAAQFSRVGGPQIAGPRKEEMPVLDQLEPGNVRLTLHESIPSHARWLLQGESWPNESVQVDLDSFVLPRLPIVYDDWGIRRDWKPPVLARLAADVRLPVGTHRVLIRTRSLARLWIDGRVVARNEVSRLRRGNLEKILPVPDPPMPGGRRAGFTQQETIETVTIDEAQAERALRVILEWTVGDKNRRVQTGEVCVAIQPGGSGDFYLLQPARLRESNRSNEPAEALPLSEVAMKAHLREVQRNLVLQDDQRRRLAASSRNAFWNRRHEIAREIASARQPEPPTGEATHPIDRFIAHKISKAIRRSESASQQQTAHFYENVLPILRDECFRCHGKKSQGGLRLDSRDAVLSSGESELPAVIPGNPEESELIARVRVREMPPTAEGLSNEQIGMLEDWVRAGAAWPDPPFDHSAVVIPDQIGEASLLRRLYLDTIGVPPTEAEAKAFLEDDSVDRTSRWIDRLLADERYADHWVSMWLDLLAENPTLLNVAMGSTGPFRWFLYESLRDNKPLDRMVTELILMRGSAARGGSSGFAMAGENDAPMAAKAHILASAFLGVEMGCARCHDSPYHSTTQEDLFSLAAMLSRQPVKPPASSRVPDAFFEKRSTQSLIRVSLPPDTSVQPEWPLATQLGLEDSMHVDPLMSDPQDSRERLAALFTTAQNERFAQVAVNHLWNRLLGAGIVQPIHDWERGQPSHPKMLAWLADELIISGYDMKHLLRLILTSEVYARRAIGHNRDAEAKLRFFAAPDQRRMTAEQVVDALYVATGHEMDVEEMTFVHDNSHVMGKRLSLGKPRRAWMFAGLGNERDRPSLSMPKAQAVADVLKAFGWTGTRQQAIPERDIAPNVLQPGVLANGDLTKNLARASWRSHLSELAIAAKSPDALVKKLFVRFLTRLPSEGEQTAYVRELAEGFDSRVVDIAPCDYPRADPPLPISTWTNHLLPKANEVQIERAARVRRGPPVDPRLESRWREAYEDAIWSLINHREFVWIP